MKIICSTSRRHHKDQISHLPDEIQTHILSFLSIEDAFRTSLLSHQWRHACSSLPKLKFIQSEFYSKKTDFKFNEVIDQVLRVHDESNIDTLHFVFDVVNEPAATNHQLDEWISIAVSHHVRVFILRENRARSPLLYTIPSSLITCTTLTGLGLENIQVNVPTTKNCLPSLDHLALKGCSIKNAVFSDCNCPMLKFLYIRECYFDMLLISTSTLNYLRIQYESNWHAEINLSIPNLANFDYTAKEPPNISLETLSSLKHALIRVTTQHSSNKDHVRKMFKGLHNVSTLGLNEFFLESLKTGSWERLINNPAARCSSLKVLSLVYTSESQLPVLRLLLRCYPNLQSLKLMYKERSRMPEYDNKTGRYWEEKERSPGNILNHLETVDFMRCRGKDREFELMNFLVENATGLKKLKISSPGVEEITEERMKNWEKLRSPQNSKVLKFLTRQRNETHL